MLSAFLSFADTLTLAAEAAGHEESSKTLFYVAGAVLAVYAVILATIGIRQHDFPATKSQARGVFGLSALLVVFVMASAIITG